MTWPDKRLGDIAHLNIGRTPPRKNPDYWTDDLTYPFLSIAEMDGKIVDPVNDAVTQAALDDGKAKLIPAGALLMSFKLTIGKVAFAAREMCTNEAIVWIDVHDDQVLPEYLALALEVADLTAGQSVAVKGNTLNKSSMKDIRVAVPPLEVQRRVVDLVHHIEAAVDAAREWEERLAHAVRQQAVSLLSVEGRNQVIGDLVDHIGGVWGDLPGENEVDVAVYRSTEYTSFGDLAPETAAVRSVSERQLATRRVGPRTLLIEKSGGTKDRPVGRVVRSRVDEPTGLPAIASNFILLAEPKDGVDHQHLFWALWGLHASGRTRQVQAASTNIHNLNTTGYLALALPIPEDDVRRALTQAIEATNEARVRAATNAACLRQLRDTVLRDVLSGQAEIPASYDGLLGEEAAA